MLDKIHDPELGLKFFDWVSNRPYTCSLDVFAYSSLLKLLAKYRVFSEVEGLLDCMKNDDKLPTNEAFDIVLRAYLESGLVDKALRFYLSELKVRNVVPSLLSCNYLLDGLVKNGNIVAAMDIYDHIIGREDFDDNLYLDNYSTGIIVRGLCQQGEVEKGVEIIENRWGKGCIPNVVFYNMLIDGHCKKGEVEKAHALFKELKKKDFLPTVQTYGAMIYGFCGRGDFDCIEVLLEEMHARGLQVNAYVRNTILEARYKHGHVLDSLGVARETELGCEPDIVTFNTMISLACRDEKVEEAEKLLEQARNRALVPNRLTYTPLVHMYSRRGDLDRVSDLFVEMIEHGHTPDLPCYGALTHGLIVAGEVDTAMSIRYMMINRGVFPDAAIYNVLMSGLFKKGKINDAKQLLSEMLLYNVSPDAYIYATLVDGLIRNGDLAEAKKILRTKY